MHQALYRKWRPQIFDDVCGQEHITSVLRYEVEQGALSHAYLFCGSRGTGKTTCAKILSKAANCESPERGNPCGKCAACRAIDAGAATDVLEMDAASNNGVENIRDIRDEVVYTPSSLKYRVYIVDEVHMLSSSAFNALLKTLEEPPAHVIFILATTELNKLPSTIVSRCQRFDFRRIATSVLAERISYIARQEGFTLDPDAAERIAKHAQGGMRDAISLLELCGSAKKHISVQTVNEMVGSIGREGMLPVVRAVIAADYDAIFAAIDEAVASSRDLTVFWQDLIALYRDMLVLKTASTAARYLDLTDAEAASLTELTASLSRATLLAHCKLLEDALFAMQNANAIKRMVAELTLVRMCDPTLDTSPQGMLSRIERLEDAVAGIPMTLPATAEMASAPVAPAMAAPIPAAADRPAAKPAVAPAAPKAAPQSPPKKAETGPALQRMRGYMNLVERMRRENPMYASFLPDARGYTDAEGHVILQFKNDFALMMLGEEGKAALARSLCAELKRPVTPSDILLQVCDTDAPDDESGDLDELLNAAEQQ